MRTVTFLIAGLMVLGTLVCNSAWALPGDAMVRVHATPLHSHATPGHAHDGDQSAADPCDLTPALNAPSVTVAALQPPATVVVLPAIDAIPTTASRAPLPPTDIRALPIAPVHQHVVLLI